MRRNDVRTYLRIGEAFDDIYQLNSGGVQNPPVIFFNKINFIYQIDKNFTLIKIKY